MSVEDLLTMVKKPSRYLGNEYNVSQKDWHEADIRAVLAFPDLYEIGMSHQGLQILYHRINAQQHYLAERVYTPDKDLEGELRRHREPLFSLESRRPLTDFDLLGITLPYELCYTNILTILDLAGLPFKSAERNENHPLVIAGGPCAFHPEPVADFFDAILLGDGEEAVVSIMDTLAKAKQDGVPRQALLERLSRIAGVYVPSFFEPHYSDDGHFASVKPLHADYNKVRRAVLSDLDASDIPASPLVPLAKIVHDRLGLEVARGCTRGCRFCQAGIIYRPVRERHPQQVLALAEKGIADGGFEELALLSLSTGDYSCLSPLLTSLMDRYASHHVSVSMPSMRVGTLHQEIMEQIKRVRKTGFTIAPEAGSDRLRKIINKGITEEDLLSTCKAAFELGWKVIKLYFMCGLPMEKEEDLVAIGTLLEKALSITGSRKGRNINASIGVFVPKPHTPFQWQGQLSIDEGYERVKFIKERLPKGASLKWNDPKLSFLEGVFSRGDRRLAPVIEQAWRDGARLDGWSEHFNLTLWRQAAEKCAVDLDSYLQPRCQGKPLPWDHLDAGIDNDFLEQELSKAAKEEYTPDCRNHGCQKCGLCDFKTVKPVVYSGIADKPLVAPNKSSSKGVPPVPQGQEGHFYYQINYSRKGPARFLGHLELLQAMFRAIRRAGLPMNYSKGFHPSPKVSFGPALPVGTESLAEYLVVDLFEPLSRLEEWQDRLDQEMPLGITVNDIFIGQKRMPAKVETTYRIDLKLSVTEDCVDRFVQSEEYVLDLVRKKKKRRINVRPLVRTLKLNGTTLEMSLMSETGTAGVKPSELVARLFNLDEEKVNRLLIIKTGYKVI